MFGDSKYKNLENSLSQVDGKLSESEASQKRIEAKLDKYTTYLNGLAKGTMTEKFEVLKKEMRNFLVTEISTAVDAKVLATMTTMLTGDKNQVVKPATPAAGIPAHLEKEVALLSKEMKDFKIARQKEYQMYCDKLATLETNLSKSTEIIEKFTQFFAKFEKERSSLDITNL